MIIGENIALLAFDVRLAAMGDNRSGQGCSGHKNSKGRNSELHFWFTSSSCPVMLDGPSSTITSISIEPAVSKVKVSGNMS